METRDIIILAAVLAFAGFRLYQKYVKKENIKSGSRSKNSDSTILSDSKGDDYEPYSNK